MRTWGAAVLHVGGSGVVEALTSVRATSHDTGVVVVLAVVLPSTLAADLIPSTLGQVGVPTTRARVRASGRGGEDVLLLRVLLEPAGSLGDQFLVRE